MDFNDIKARLERVYLSINARFDDEIEKHTKIERIKTKKIEGMFVSFNKINKESEALNKVFTIIHNLANLKHHLKNIMKGRGEDVQIIEEEINQSFYLKLIVDLSNQEKHGYPLTEDRISKRDPQIQNLGSALQLTATKDNPSWFRIHMDGKDNE